MAINAVLVGTVGHGAANTATTGSGTTAASGSTFAIYFQIDITYGSITTIGDNKGNTYSAKGTLQADDSGSYGQWYVCENGAGGSGHTATITTSANSYPSIHLIEITGATTTPTDKLAQGQDLDNTPFTLASGVLSQADEVILAACANNNTTSSSNTYSSSNFTILGQESDASQYWTSATAKLVVSSTSSVTASFTVGGGGTKAGLAIVTFKAAAVAAAPDSYLVLPPMRAAGR